MLFVNAHMRTKLTALAPDEGLSPRDYVKGELLNRKAYFSAEFVVGSDNDTVRVWVGTGLNLLWFPTYLCFYYYSYKRDTLYDLFRCLSGGVYSPASLSSFINTTKVFHYENVFTSRYARGYFGTDVIEYGDFRGNITFGIGTNTSFVGQLGLGFPSNALASSEATLNQPSFLEQLVENGHIKSNAYSFQMGLNNASEGTLLLGAVDHAKYEEPLQKVRMVDMFLGGPSSVLILFDGFLGNGFNSDVNIPIEISMEYTGLSFPYGSIDGILEYLEVENDNFGNYLVQCNLLNLTELISFYFSGVEIQVPVRNLVSQVSSGFCVLSIIEGPGLAYIGDDILQSAYFVVDLNNKEVALAQAKNSSNENIEDIISTIPLALEAPLYSYTNVAKKYSYETSEWFTSLYKVPHRPKYSTNTGSRSVDWGNTTYRLEFSTSSDYYGYWASRNGGDQGKGIGSGLSTLALLFIQILSTLL